MFFDSFPILKKAISYLTMHGMILIQGDLCFFFFFHQISQAALQHIFPNMRNMSDLNCLIAQIIEPLKAMATGAPLEDARGLAQRYSRLRHEAETLVRTCLVLCR